MPITTEYYSTTFQTLQMCACYQLVCISSLTELHRQPQINNPGPFTVSGSGKHYVLVLIASASVTYICMCHKLGVQMEPLQQ